MWPSIGGIFVKNHTFYFISMRFERSTLGYDRALYLEYKIHFREYLGFHCRDFPENLHLSPITHALQTLQILLRSATYQGHCTCRTQYIFGSISSSNERISPEICTYHFSLQTVQVLLRLANN